MENESIAQHCLVNDSKSQKVLLKSNQITKGKLMGHTDTYYSIRELIESVVSKRLLPVLSHKRLAFFTALVVIVISCINGQLIQARILWHCCSQSGADGSFENGAKIQSDVDAGAVREMQPTEQIAIKINGHISNILSRPGPNFYQSRTRQGSCDHISHIS